MWRDMYVGTATVEKVGHYIKRWRYNFRVISLPFLAEEAPQIYSTQNSCLPTQGQKPGADKAGPCGPLHRCHIYCRRRMRVGGR